MRSRRVEESKGAGRQGGTAWRVAIVAALLIFAASAAFAAPDISVWPQSVLPGDPVFITMKHASGEEAGSCRWLKKQYDLADTTGGLCAVLPVPAGAKPGTYHLAVTCQGVGESGETRDFTVTVRPRAFAVQRLRMSASLEAKYVDPEVKHEYKLIGAALDRVTPEELWHGSFLMPVKGRMSTAYGLRRYINGRFSYRHRGIDIAAPQGTPVRAPADGVVSLADDSFHLHGKTVIIDHGLGVSSLYIHLSRIDVKVGMQVKRGQIIGQVGRTGAATGPNLHYGVYVHHVPMDPTYWTHLPTE